MLIMNNIDDIVYIFFEVDFMIYTELTKNYVYFSFNEFIGKVVFVKMQVYEHYNNYSDNRYYK